MRNVRNRSLGARLIMYFEENPLFNQIKIYARK